MERQSSSSSFSSSSSVVSTSALFKPKFTLQFMNQITKDGDIVTYTFAVIPIDNNFEEQIIQRQHEDFEWLEHCLTTSVNISGVIVPPLPCKPQLDAKLTDVKNKQFGSFPREMRGDGFHKNYKTMEMYLNSILTHNTFGKDIHLVDFLTKLHAPSRVKIKKGILTLISNRLDGWKATHRDCDEFFQKEKDWTFEFGSNILKFTEDINKVVYGQQRLCNALGQISTDLTTCFCSNDTCNEMYLQRLMGRLADGLNDLKQSIEVQVYNDELILVSTFEFYTRYVEAEKEMLARRTSLLINYENCNKAMDKAKCDKYEMMKSARNTAETLFEECSDVARREIKMFHGNRINALLDSLNLYAQAQLKVACDTYAVLANSLNMLEKLQN